MDIKSFSSLFKKNEIEKIEYISYLYNNRKKIVTFVPLKNVDKLTFEMSFAGAGKIGNYDFCSFRMKGLGTYMPGNKTNPFIGEKGKLSFEEEIRLEMECGEEELEKVIDALLINHPYEEVAYEIYDFKKRSNIPNTIFISFKKVFSLKDLISKINKKIQIKNIDNNIKIKNLFFTIHELNNSLLKKAKDNNCNLIIFSEKNQIKFKFI